MIKQLKHFYRFSSIMQKQKISLDFCKELPKIELHAHLAGSVRRDTLIDLLNQKGIQADQSSFTSQDMKAIFKIFDFIYKGLTTLEDIKRVTQEVLEDFKNDNTVYLELRSTPKSNETFTQEDYLKVIFNEIIKFDEQFGDQMTVRFILSIDRLKDVKEAENRLKLYKQFKQDEKYGKYLVGLDWCGNPFKHTFSDFLHVFQEAKQLGIPTTVHTAEIPNVFEETQCILDFKPDRIGHFNIYDENLFKQIIQSKIPIESCPTSNLYTLVLNNYGEHHFDKFYKLNHPITINTDDTACFGQNLSEEFYNISDAFNYQYKDIQKILQNSVDIMFDKSQQAQVQEKIDNFFKQRQ